MRSGTTARKEKGFALYLQTYVRAYLDRVPRLCWWRQAGRSTASNVQRGKERKVGENKISNFFEFLDAKKFEGRNETQKIRGTKRYPKILRVTFINKILRVTCILYIIYYA